MTLGDTIAAVQQLGITCSLILSDGETRGSGIKLLRLVSKQLRTAMLGVVQNYTLHLNGSCTGLMNEMTVLQATRLSCLRVVVSNTDQSPASLQGWDTYAFHLRCFLHGMGAAVQCITRLEVDSRCIDDSAEAVAVLLSRLGVACPALQQLQVTGKIQRSFLEALGASCLKLSSLEVMDGVLSEAFQQLHQSLPRLTHCKAEAPLWSGRNYPPEAGMCCIAMLSCPLLTFLDIGSSSITPEMWPILPSGIRELRCALGIHSPLISMRPLGSLKRLWCNCNPCGNHILMDPLVAVLRVAPNLMSLTVSGHGMNTEGSGVMSEVFQNGDYDSIPDLVYLNERIASGLKVTSTLCAGGASFPGVNVSLSLLEDETSYDDIAAYLQQLPTLLAVTSLHLARCITEDRWPMFTKHIAVVFPNLVSLALILPDSVSSRDLHHLGCFSALQYLSLTEGEVSLTSLAVLCTHMPNMKMLYLRGCGGLSVKDGKELQSTLNDWGLLAKVMVLA